jgi:hypothetical protein
MMVVAAAAVPMGESGIDGDAVVAEEGTSDVKVGPMPSVGGGDVVAAAGTDASKEDLEKDNLGAEGLDMAGVLAMVNGVCL